MQLIKQCLAMGMAGSLGALARFFVAKHLESKFETNLPLGTMVVNLSGCFILGFFMAVTSGRLAVSDTTKLAIGVGFVGAYTTFSTLMYDSVKLSQDGEHYKAGLNLLISLLVGLAAVWLGAICGRRI